MTVQPLAPDGAPLGATVTPDAPNPTAAPADAASDGGIFSGVLAAVRDAGSALGSAGNAESAFAAGRGDLQTMVFERARADALLEIASAGASKAAQALNTIVNMQV